MGMTNFTQCGIVLIWNRFLLGLQFFFSKGCLWSFKLCSRTELKVSRKACAVKCSMQKQGINCPKSLANHKDVNNISE